MEYYRDSLSLIPALFSLAAFAFCSTVRAETQPLDLSQARLDTGKGIAWYDVRLLGVEGKGWSDTEGYYDRLPARARGVVRQPVWDLSRHSAGLCVRFTTNARSISVAWDGGEAMPHMAATGVSGVDLYVRREGEWRFLRVGKPGKGWTVDELISGLPGNLQEYILYLPLYNRVTKVELGVPKEALLSHLPSPEGKPVVFYGTSITQGGCASRPGMCHTALLGRWLDREIINLGFSGNGMMEPEMAALLAELDPALYVIDCIPNVDLKIGELTAPLVKIIRAKHPDTRILLVEDVRPGDEPANALLRREYKKLVEAGDENLFLMAGQNMLGGYGLEATVDGRHPTDLGFMKMAEAFRPVIETLLGE